MSIDTWFTSDLGHILNSLDYANQNALDVHAQGVATEAERNYRAGFTDALNAMRMALGIAMKGDQ